MKQRTCPRCAIKAIFSAIFWAVTPPTPVSIGLLVLNSVDEPERYSTYFMKIDGVKFRQKVVPGDTLILRLELLAPIRRGISTMKGYVFVGDKLVSEAEFMAQIVKNK